MRDDERYRLIHGPYAAPSCRRGGLLACEYRGEEVRVGGLTDTPIPWPRLMKSGHPSLIVCGDLARAVRSESALAVAHHWGVSPTTVWKWRQALGVPRINEGTGRLFRDYLPEKVKAEAVAKMIATQRTPEVRSRISAAKRGRPAHPATAAALLRAARRKKKAAHRRAIAKALVRAHAATPRPWRVVNPADRPWTPREDRLLGTTLDRVVAGMIGRTIPAVRQRRRSLGIRCSRHSDLCRSPRP